jgi:hypothetical protein
MIDQRSEEAVARPPALRPTGSEPPATPAAPRLAEPGGAGGPPGATTVIELEVAGWVIARARIVKP